MSTEPLDPGRLRVGDLDRHQMADRLASAHALGQLDVDEFHDRVTQAHSARTRAELDAVAADLPVAGSAPGRTSSVQARVAQAGPRLKAAGSMLGAVPRQMWVVLAAMALTLMVGGMVFGAGHPEGRGPSGRELPTTADQMAWHGHPHGGGFLAGALAMLVLGGRRNLIRYTVPLGVMVAVLAVETAATGISWSPYYKIELKKSATTAADH